MRRVKVSLLVTRTQRLGLAREVEEATGVGGHTGRGRGRVTYNRGWYQRTRLRFIGGLGSVVALAALPFLLLPATATATGGVVVPKVGTVVAGKLVHWLPAAEASKQVTPAQLHGFPLHRLSYNPKGLRAHTSSVAGTAIKAPTALALAEGPPVAQVNQPGLQARDAGGSIPPDTTGAIGPNHYLEFVNELVGVYDRSLTLLSSQDLSFFVNMPGASVFDPQILFDAGSNRWYYVADVGFNLLGMGWSKTADPSDLLNGWCNFFSPNTGTVFHDDPKLGGDDNFITIGTNGYTGVPGPPDPTFVTSFIWVTPKPMPGDTSCTAVSANVFGDPATPLRNADGTIMFTPVPAHSTDANATGYIVAAHGADVPAPGDFPETKVMALHTVRRVDGSGGLIADGDMTVNSFDIPASAPQPGVSYLIDTNDTRLTHAVGRTDPDAGAQAVWTQHAIAGPGGRAVMRWYEFLPGSLMVRQQGEIQDATDFVFMGAISPSSAGNAAAIFYNRSSSSTLPLLAAQSRTSTTPLGTMDPGELLLGNSVDPLQETGFGDVCNVKPCRWGDYALAIPDPATSNLVWGAGELSGAYNGGAAQWVTRNYAVTP